MTLEQKSFTRLYRQARSQADLPWHREQPPALLDRVVASRGRPGRALDLGCGEGVATAYLAFRGYSVVGVDFVPAALKLAHARAQSAGVRLKLVEADVVDYAPGHGFEVVLDSGCLHHIPAARIPRYCARLADWMLPGGDFVLIHLGKRHALDWRPLGPRRRPRTAIVELFGALRLQAYEETSFDLPFPLGPRALAGVYWFRRPGSSGD